MRKNSTSTNLENKEQSTRRYKTEPSERRGMCVGVHVCVHPVLKRQSEHLFRTKEKLQNGRLKGGIRKE